MRLSKRWISSQMLSSHLPSLAIELIIAHLYKNSAPYNEPHTPHLGFIRFLGLLANTNWKLSPLMINLNHSFSGNE